MKQCVAKTRRKRDGARAVCHPDLPEMSRGMCQPCYKRWLKSTAPEDRIPVDRSTWKPKTKKIPDCHPDAEYGGYGLCKSCYLKKYRAENIVELKAMAREKHFKSTYGLTVEQRNFIYHSQGGLCAICARAIKATGKSSHLDHCHTTGVIRGILCNSCNWFLSRIDADPQILDRIKTHRSKAWNKADLEA